ACLVFDRASRSFGVSDEFVDHSLEFSALLPDLWRRISIASGLRILWEQGFQLRKLLLKRLQAGLHLAKIQRRLAFHHFEVDAARFGDGLHGIAALFDGVEVLSQNHSRTNTDSD